MKACTKCGASKDAESFYKTGKGEVRQSACKECVKLAVKANYAARREQYARYERKRYQDPTRHAYVIEQHRIHNQRNPDKYKARTAVGNALRDWRIEKLPCKMCGTTFKVQAHHHDYSKPLYVSWLCFECHRQEEHGQTVTSHNQTKKAS